MKSGILFTEHIGRSKKVVAAILIYLALIVGFSYISYRIVLKSLLADLGNKAMILAVDTTHWVRMDSGEFDRLLSLEFNDLLKDPVNVAFEKRAREVMAVSQIKYLYLEAPVPKDRVKYQVEAGEEETYGVPAGTPLDVVYLLDAVVSEEARNEDTGGQGYTDKDRYTVRLGAVTDSFDTKKPGYVINTDQWGSYITGYAPIYGTDGAYQGVIGVDLYLDKYYEYIRQNLMVFGGFLLFLFAAGMFFFYMMVLVWKKEERLRLEQEMAATDSLTGVLNHRSFTDRIEQVYHQCRRDGMPMCLLLIDVDDLKRINETYGTMVGDRLLAAVGGVIREEVKRASDLACRYGGDEFVVLLHNTENEGGRFVAECIRNAVRNLHFPDFSDADKAPTVTVGVVSLIPNEDITLDLILKTADEAYFYARKDGYDRLAVWDEME